MISLKNAEHISPVTMRKSSSEIDLSKTFSNVLELRAFIFVVLLVDSAAVFFVIWAYCVWGWIPYLEPHTWYIPLCLSVAVALVGFIFPDQALDIMETFPKFFFNPLILLFVPQ